MFSISGVSSTLIPLTHCMRFAFVKTVQETQFLNVYCCSVIRDERALVAAGAGGGERASVVPQHVSNMTDERTTASLLCMHSIGRTRAAHIIYLI